jgi:hypothetical protein
MQFRATCLQVESKHFYSLLLTDSEQMACVWRMSVDVEGAVFNWMTGTYTACVFFRIYNDDAQVHRDDKYRHVRDFDASPSVRSHSTCPLALAGAEIDESSWEVQYAVAFYWACMTVTTIGYGDVVCSIQVGATWHARFGKNLQVRTPLSRPAIMM